MGNGSFLRYLKYSSAFYLLAEDIVPIGFSRSQY